MESITKTYHVDGMSCAACAASVERILNKYDGTIAYLSRDKAFQIELLI